MLALLAGLCVIALFVPPIHGLADNGDYWRIMEPLGVGHPSTDYAQSYFGHIVRKFEFVQRRAPHVLSSQSLLAEVARLINPLFASGGGFDLRSMALAVGGGVLVLFVYGLASTRNAS